MKRVEIIPEDINLEPDISIQVYCTTYAETDIKEAEETEDAEGQQDS